MCVLKLTLASARARWHDSRQRGKSLGHLLPVYPHLLSRDGGPLGFRLKFLHWSRRLVHKAVGDLNPDDVASGGSVGTEKEGQNPRHNPTQGLLYYLDGREYSVAHVLFNLKSTNRVRAMSGRVSLRSIWSSPGKLLMWGRQCEHCKQDFMRIIERGVEGLLG